MRSSASGDGRTLASEVDLLPTSAGLAAPGYASTTLGRDLFDPQFAEQRYAFISPDVGRSEYGLVGPRFMLMLNKNDGTSRLYDTQSTDNADNVIDQYPEIGKEMTTLTEAIYETTRYMLYHNKNISSK